MLRTGCPSAVKLLTGTTPPGVWAIGLKRTQIGQTFRTVFEPVRGLTVGPGSWRKQVTGFCADAIESKGVPNAATMRTVEMSRRLNIDVPLNEGD
jgi:hypothetical protein